MEPESPSNPLKQIRTFQGDVAEALSRQKESLVSIQLTEHARQEERIAEEAPRPLDPQAAEKRKFLFLILGSVLLISIAIVGGLYTYGEYVRKTAVPVIETIETQFIPPANTLDLNLSGATRQIFLDKWYEAIGNTPPTELRQVALRIGEGDNAPLIKTADFLTLLGSHASGALVRSFSDLFMLGTLGNDPFIIIKLNSFENAFPGMLNWESTLIEDLGPVFASLETLKTIPPTAVFKDVTIKNKDARILDPVLLYSFFENEMLVITTNTSTLQILIDRLTREKLAH